MCKEPSLQRCRTVDRRRQSSAEAAHRRGVVQSGITPADVTGRTSYVARTLTKLPFVSPSRLVMHCDVATGTRRMPGQQRYLTHRYTHVYLCACMCTCVCTEPHTVSIRVLLHWYEDWSKDYSPSLFYYCHIACASRMLWIHINIWKVYLQIFSTQHDKLAMYITYSVGTVACVSLCSFIHFLS